MLCLAVLRRTEADGGHWTDSAPAALCCHHPAAGCSLSARSSPRVPSCCPHLCASKAPAAAFTPDAAWSWQRESGATRLCLCQARWSARASSISGTGEPETPSSGDSEYAPSPGGGLGGKSCLPFLGYPNFQNSFLCLRFPRGQGRQCMRHSLDTPSSFANGHQGLVRGRNTFSRAPYPAVEPGKCGTVHSDPTSGPCALLSCPKAWMSVAPLALVRSIGAWKLALPRPSR